MAKVENLTRADVDGADPSWGTVRRDLEVLSSDIARLGEKSLSEGQEKVSQELDRLKANVADISRRVGQKSQASVDAAAEMVRQRPLTSVLGAFVAGVLLASLTGRRR